MSRVEKKVIFKMKNGEIANVLEWKSNVAVIGYQTGFLTYEDPSVPVDVGALRQKMELEMGGPLANRGIAEAVLRMYDKCVSDLNDRN